MNYIKFYFSCPLNSLSLAFFSFPPRHVTSMILVVNIFNFFHLTNRHYSFWIRLSEWTSDWTTNLQPLYSSACFQPVSKDEICDDDDEMSL